MAPDTEATNELDQHCVINGHEWSTHHWFEYGLVLGPKTSQFTRVCANCGEQEVIYFVPASSSPSARGRFSKILRT